MNVKIIGNIEPFNECFYYSCFYNALFPVLSHFNKSIFPVMINGVPWYDIGTERGYPVLYSQFEFVKSVKQLLEEMGLIVDIKEKSEDVIEDTLKALSLNKPVILAIDCFYSSIRKDLYLKEHWLHSLLFHGYDRSKKIFYVIEQDDRENLSFTEKTIPINDVTKCYKGYLKYFYKKGDFTYFSFGRDSTEKTQNDFSLNTLNKHYRENLRKIEDIIYEGFNNLTGYSKELHHILIDEDLLRESCPYILDGFNNIIKSKNAQQYLLDKLAGPDSVEFKILDEIINTWIMVRILIGKYYFSGVYKPKSLLKIIDLITKITFLENQYYKVLTDQDYQS